MGSPDQQGLCPTPVVQCLRRFVPTRYLLGPSTVSLFYSVLCIASFVSHHAYSCPDNSASNQRVRRRFWVLVHTTPCLSQRDRTSQDIGERRIMDAYELLERGLEHLARDKLRSTDMLPRAFPEAQLRPLKSEPVPSRKRRWPCPTLAKALTPGHGGAKVAHLLVPRTWDSCTSTLFHTWRRQVACRPPAMSRGCGRLDCGRQMCHCLTRPDEAVELYLDLHSTTCQLSLRPSSIPRQF
ncbi:hypothetical protein LIA77_01926 [Sarocladium implicatum]|nr:hypothetical protein LIA77_01926 [Sarocladium implicatum]